MYFIVRDLGLDVSVDDLNVTTDDTIEGTIEARDSNRPMTVELLDSDGDTVQEKSYTLSGQGEVDYEFSADRDTGDYTVLVTDQGTLIERETSTITISEADDRDAGFADGTVSEQRGDIVEMTVEMTSTDYASITVGPGCRRERNCRRRRRRRPSDRLLQHVRTV